MEPSNSVVAEGKPQADVRPPQSSSPQPPPPPRLTAKAAISADPSS